METQQEASNIKVFIKKKGNLQISTIEWKRKANIKHNITYFQRRINRDDRIETGSELFQPWQDIRHEFEPRRDFPFGRKTSCRK